MLSINNLTTPDVKLEKWLNQDPIRNGLLLYNITIGFDLVDWFVASRNEKILACLSLYKGNPDIHSLISRGNASHVKQLFNQLDNSLIFAIIPKMHRLALVKFYQFQTAGEFHLMYIERGSVCILSTESTERLTANDLHEVDRFYKSQEADAWHPKQLEFGTFYCIRKAGYIVSICGTIGTYPQSPGVAVIGNLLTLPDYRKQGYGTAVLCAVINELFERYRYITLLVESDNKNAIRIYERLGFCFYESFDIGLCQRKR